MTEVSTAPDERRRGAWSGVGGCDLARRHARGSREGAGTGSERESQSVAFHRPARPKAFGCPFPDPAPVLPALDPPPSEVAARLDTSATSRGNSGSRPSTLRFVSVD